MKQETIEEALNYQLNFIHDVVRNKDFDLGFQTGGILGAKWQAERSFNNEEVIKIIQECKSYLSFGDEFDEIKWFEQFKKK
jgi:hypothetical protein